MKSTMWIPVLALAFGASAWADSSVQPTMSEEAYEAAEQRIEAEADARRAACKRLPDKARDLCQLEAKGWEKVALARLHAENEPSPESERAAKEAEADAALAVAKERCESAGSKAKRKACVKRAEHEHEAAIRLAKVQKVEAMNALKAKAEKEARAQVGQRS